MKNRLVLAYLHIGLWYWRMRMVNAKTAQKRLLLSQKADRYIVRLYLVDDNLQMDTLEQA